MPHLKCEPCQVRLQRAAEPAVPMDLCPRCGQPLRAVGELSELVGLRAIDLEVPSPGSGAPNAGYERLAASVAEIMARRRAVEGRPWLGAKRWAP
jgi:Zn-finger nucleic acid-binding protein